jgi:hypothetical protein
MMWWIMTIVDVTLLNIDVNIFNVK